MANITYIRIGDEVYRLHDGNALTSDSNLNASKVVGTLPANTYIDTTYENKAAVEGGTDVSLVTTGDKYRWNQGGSGSSEVFVAEYGVTPFQDILDAINAEKIIYLNVSSKLVPVSVNTYSSFSIVLNGLLYDFLYRYTINKNEEWIYQYINIGSFQTAADVEAAINTKIASVYKAKGSVAFLDLPVLTSSNEGFVYDINESFTTTSDFVEGAGVTYPAGTNVVIIDIGSGVYKYDVLAGLVDLSGKQDTLVSGTNIKTINGSSVLGSGNLTISSGLQNLVDGSAIGSVRGINTTAENSSYTMGINAFAEGTSTKASGHGSHAEGTSTKASGLGSHAEGNLTTASASASHAEGYGATARGWVSHAEGYGTLASGDHSHAQNYNTIAVKKYQTAIGKYNIEDTETIENLQKAFVIGNGSADNNRSNALTVDWQGNVDIASGAKYKINGTPLSASDVGAQPTLTAGLLIDLTNNIISIDGPALLDIVYPVGSYYETSDTSFNPNTAWGGTWTLETEGQVHISAGTNYEVEGALTNTTDGGEKTHTLSVSEMPSHTHALYYYNASGNKSFGYQYQNKGSQGSEATSSSGIVNSGGGQPHNIMQPYIVVNRWHRTA